MGSPDDMFGNKPDRQQTFSHQRLGHPVPILAGQTIWQPQTPGVWAVEVPKRAVVKKCITVDFLFQANRDIAAVTRFFKQGSALKRMGR